jgi:pimeloyl-ACP methyl ester carboxylesterase
MKIARSSLWTAVLFVPVLFALTGRGVSGPPSGALGSAGPRIQELGTRPAEPAVIEKMVNVGPVNLFFRIYQGGEQTVLLESGGGLDSGEWTAFAPRLAEATGATVVTYDRAGFGKSDLPDTPYDLVQERGWLWDALRQLGLDEDLILAGHSYGGFLIRYDSATRADAVRGLVFIDPFTVELVDILGLDFCNTVEGLGKLPKLSPEEYAKLGKVEKADLRMGGYPDGNLAAICALARPLRVPRGIPIRVLTSGQSWLPENVREAWRQAHERFAASMPGAKLLIAAESDHMIPKRQPDLVLKAVTEVIAQAKSESEK